MALVSGRLFIHYNIMRLHYALLFVARGSQVWRPTCGKIGKNAAIQAICLNKRLGFGNYYESCFDHIANTGVISRDKPPVEQQRLVPLTPHLNYCL